MSFEYRTAQLTKCLDDIWRKIPTFCLLLALAACSRPPTPAELGEYYVQNPAVYERLKTMIFEDGKDREKCFAVGTDHIGDFWNSSFWNSDDYWHHFREYETNVSLQSVLVTEGLTPERFEEYLKLFKEANAERITFCAGTKPWGDTIDVLVYRAGIAVSGCSGSIEWFERSSRNAEGSRDGSFFTEVAELENGWYALLDCT